MEILELNYSAPLVIGSYFISALGAFIGLSASRYVVGTYGKANKLNLLSAGIALGGIGVWAMHFTGMLAVRLPVGYAYSMTETVLSLVVVVMATSMALLFVARDPWDLGRVVVAGVMLGLAICFMHYLGMYGMRFGGFFEWSALLVMASVLIAIVAATGALWLTFNIQGRMGALVAAFVMAAAISSMHYTGMAAADFVCTTPASPPEGRWLVASPRLPHLVLYMVLGFALLLALDQAVNYRTRERRRNSTAI